MTGKTIVFLSYFLRPSFCQVITATAVNLGYCLIRDHIKYVRIALSLIKNMGRDGLGIVTWRRCVCTRHHRRSCVSCRVVCGNDGGAVDRLLRRGSYNDIF